MRRSTNVVARMIDENLNANIQVNICRYNYMDLYYMNLLINTFIYVDLNERVHIGIRNISTNRDSRYSYLSECEIYTDFILSS